MRWKHHAFSATRTSQASVVDSVPKGVSWTGVPAAATSVTSFEAAATEADSDRRRVMDNGGASSPSRAAHAILEAILLDTAGRYTTQDSDSQVDRSAWEGFLGLLKK